MFLIDSPPVENSGTAALVADEDEDEGWDPARRGQDPVDRARQRAQPNLGGQQCGAQRGYQQPALL